MIFILTSECCLASKKGEMNSIKQYDCSIHEVVALENGVRQRVLQRLIKETYFIFYKWLPPEIVTFICKFNMPMAVVAYKVTSNQFKIEYRSHFRHGTSGM